MACGGNHTMLLLDDGTLYGCGDNSKNQLCSDVTVAHWKEWKPLSGAGNIKYKDVACGWEFAVVINDKNEILSRGCGLKGELGLGKEFSKNDFVKVMDVKDGSKLFASFQNCVVVERGKYCPSDKKKSGTRIYGWGSNTKCQLFEPKCRKVDSPVLIYDNDDVTVEYVAMGKDFMLFVDEQGRIVAVTGSLPKGFIFDEWAMLYGLKVHCMWTSLHIWATEEGLAKKTGVYSIGNGTHGQLYNNEECDDLIEIKKIAVGSEHGILLCGKNSTSDVVACWGWGEHGNCGRIQDGSTGPMNDYSNAISPLNEIFTIAHPNQKKVKIFGGCATTWIVISSQC